MSLYFASRRKSLSKRLAGKDPATYLHGHGNVIPGLEKAMEGKSSG